MADLKFIAGQWRLILDFNHKLIFSSDSMQECVDHADLEGITIAPKGWVK